MTSKERFLAAITRDSLPDRLPVTTHHVMSYFLDTYLDGITTQEFFDRFGLDPIHWIVPYKPDESRGQFYDSLLEKPEHMESPRICTENWRYSMEPLDHPDYKTTRYTITTPKGSLTTVQQSNIYTTWTTEHLIKEKKQIDILADYAVAPLCDVERVKQAATAFGERGLIRGHICCFDLYGQPGCWQDACCLYGTQNLILATFDDPAWVHAFLEILQQRKRVFIESLCKAPYDILELGGGDASTTVISPTIFNTFVAPYDAPLIELAHEQGQRIVYHTCGGMMPILEDIVAMKPDAIETLTPKEMGGDVRLDEVKKRVGDHVCLIGGFDQLHYFTQCTPQETRNAVRRYFEQGGKGGGFILSPSDHFFDAEIPLIQAFAEEAHQCRYD
jgi:uroporphyrinogen decarboxylase